MGWADLMYLESEAMLYAVRTLVGHGVPSFSMHDSLIVPASKQDLAVEWLRKGYARMALTEPITLVVHHPRSDGDESDKATVLYGADNEGSQRDTAEADPANSRENADDSSEWTLEKRSGWSGRPYDPQDPEDPRNF